MSIRVILSTGSLWLMDTAYTFDLAAEAGYDGIEIMCDDRYTTRDWRYLQKLSADFGLPTPVLHTPFTSKLTGWGNARTETGKVRHTVELADKIEAESIVVHLPLRYSRASVRFGQFYAQLPWFSTQTDFRAWMASGGLKQLQSETPVQIAIENMPTKKMWGQQANPAWWNTVD
ncbi:MAG: sugar phosphate isomerase/epimerase, partial [Chloroflexota bacterium]